MQNRLNVLIVDDDMINLKLLKSMLSKNELVENIIEASNGAEAVNTLKARDDIDLVLLDIIMPIMNGTEALKVIRSDQNIKQVPIIILTTDETKKSEALELGANGFLMKPVRSGDLTQQIKTMASIS
ncbi:MAG: response regulator [Sulfurimonas sp.]|jgi:putative two-component system response regulator|nr:response regulator [Sulfurimonadaceae bacterium]